MNDLNSLFVVAVKLLTYLFVSSLAFIEIVILNILFSNMFFLQFL